MLTLWKPTWLDKQADQLFRDVAFPNVHTRNLLTPAANIVEGEKAITIELDLPGHKASDIAVSVKEDVLTVQSERKTETTDESDTYRRREVRFGSYARSFRLPQDVDGNAIEAQYTNGVLNLRIPKKEQAQPKAIEVQVA